MNRPPLMNQPYCPHWCGVVACRADDLTEAFRCGGESEDKAVMPSRFSCDRGTFRRREQAGQGIRNFNKETRHSLL